MGAVTLHDAIRKGRILLVWIPLVLLFGFIGLAVAAFAFPAIPYHLAIGIGLLLAAFILPWIWWSYQVVKWKIWAFANVDDVRTLEKRAIA